MSSNDLLKRIAAGVVGGLAGTLAMQYYWTTASALADDDPRSRTADDDAPDTLDEMSVVGQHHKEGESSTAAVGRKAHEALTDETPSSKQKTTLSETVHWGYGGAMGGVYGTLRGPTPTLDLSGGAVLGTILWTAGDELMVPLLGLSSGPTAYPLSQHLHRIGAHLVYGGATALTTQLLLRGAAGSSLSAWGWEAAKTYAKANALQTAGQQLWAALRGQRW